MYVSKMLSFYERFRIIYLRLSCSFSCFSFLLKFFIKSKKNGYHARFSKKMSFKNLQLRFTWEYIIIIEDTFLFICIMLNDVYSLINWILRTTWPATRPTTTGRTCPWHPYTLVFHYKLSFTSKVRNCHSEELPHTQTEP